MYLLSFSSTLWLSLSLVSFVFVCVFLFGFFFCFALFLCCRGQRSRALGKKKRQRKRLGRDAYFVSARTFSFQDPSLLLVQWSAEGKRVTLETRSVQSTKIVFLPTSSYSSLWNESQEIYSNKTSPHVRQRLEQST